MRLFAPGELNSGPALFDLAPPSQSAGPAEPGHAPLPEPARPSVPRPRAAAGTLAGGGQLDPDQRAAVEAASPLMIVAGPGTGKTSTLTSRIAYQLASGIAPGSCLALTFTRRAAQEMQERLAGQRSGAEVTVTTFHGLGRRLLRELHARAGLPADFQIADGTATGAIAAELAGSARAGRELLRAASTDATARQTLVGALTAHGLVDFDGLIELPVALLTAEPEVAAALRERWPRISVDE